MKNNLLVLISAVLLLLTSCGQTDENSITEAYNKSGEIPPAAVTDTAAEKIPANTETSTSAASTATDFETPPNVLKEQTQSSTTESDSVISVETDISEQNSETAAEEVQKEILEPEEQYDTFYGILIDEDCSDFEDPPLHDLPCMLMDSCRASGYGLDIQQEDGSWVFYMFDENGQELSWDYLTHTDRMYGLYVTVTGKWEDNVIKVISLEED